MCSPAASPIAAPNLADPGRAVPMPCLPRRMIDFKFVFGRLREKCPAVCRALYVREVSLFVYRPFVTPDIFGVCMRTISDEPGLTLC